ncbi:4Fe-4S binding protein [Nonomuraea mangrovi]|uniref:4Fe-4S binding protein n=1 Tax=Nonomuraea mangrovi TaxID=2316207 RepID=A0ABW4T7Z2_9ACTN
MLRRSVTQQYPEVHPDLPPRSRGVIALVEENCTSCMLCARECPDWCIYIDSHKETLPAPEGGRARQRNVLDRFAIDFALCMYCGICIEVCPFDALFWAPEFEYAEGDIRNLLHEKDRLAGWVEAVPPPPAHEVGAEPPKELAAPVRPARTAGAGRTGESAATPGRAERGPGRADRPTSTDAPTSTDSSTTSARPARTEGPARTARTEGPARTAPPEGGTAGAEPGETPAGAPVETPARETAAAQQSAPAPAQEKASDKAEEPSEPSATERRQAREPRARPTRMGNVRGIRPPGALPARETPQRGSSTGPQPDEELSTGSGASPSPPESEEQTSATEPRRRRMADPRSIRPPGGLKRHETAEPEED